MNAPRKQLALSADTLTGAELGEAFDYWPAETRPGCLLGVVIGLLRVQGFSDEEIRQLVLDGLGFELMIDTSDPTRLVLDLTDLSTLEEVEKTYLLSVYESTGENCAKTARLLGVSRRLLYRRLERYGKKTRFAK